ncbi:serine protease snake-like [Glossina fuscipes]|uniref:Serine protease snake-like n=1 Tax=Glossina fuscipes TaxID=7396 RepID=A0A9C5Z396_9MUSC|nr:serine protease snake-like [Glossina fuscipes]
MHTKNAKFKKSLISIALMVTFASPGRSRAHNIFDIQQRCNNDEGMGLCVPHNQCRTKKSSIYFYRDECEEIDGVLQICCSKAQMTVNETAIATARGATCPVRYKTIANNSTSKQREYPFMYALGWQSKGDNITIKYNCGVALISANFAITAAHCLHDEEGSPTLLRAGGRNLNDTLTPNIKISECIEHPNYSHPAIYNDIALIKLAKPVISDESFACLWTEKHIEDHSDVILLGYGQISFPHISPELLLKIDLKIHSQNDCDRDHPPGNLLGPLKNGISDKQICAIDSKKIRDHCPEDSSGPLVKLVHNDLYTVPYIVGITSIGVGCASTIPGIYTRVSDYVPWIENIIRGNSSLA